MATGMRLTKLLLFVAMYFVQLVGAVDLCTEVDPDDRLAKWKCDMDKRSYAKKGTVEHGFSIAAGAILNIGISCISGCVDLAIFCTVHLWGLLVTACLALWGLLLSYVAWLFPDICPAIWHWWYATVWEGLVVAAWETFFLLGILAFLVYALWALIGVPVCILACLVLVLLVPVIFVLVVLLMAVCFVLWLVLTVAWLLLALVVLAVTALLVLAIALLAAVVICTLVTLLLCLGWLLVWGCLSVLAMGILAFDSLFVHYRSKQLKAKRLRQAQGMSPGENGESDQPAPSRAKRFSKKAQYTLGILISTAFTFVAFLIDLQLVFSSYVIFERLSSGKADDSASGSIFPNMDFSITDASVDNFPFLKDIGITGFADSLGGIAIFIGTFSIWLTDMMDWICPGAAAIFAGSQLVVGVLISFLMRSPTVDIKWELTTLLVDSQNSGILAKGAAKIAKFCIMKVIEVMIAGPVFVLLFSPNAKAPCNYEGDVIVAVFAYLIMVTISIACFISLPSVAFGAVHKDLDDAESCLHLIFVQFWNWCLLVGAIFGVVHPEIMTQVLSSHMQVHDSLKNPWCRYQFVSLSMELAALTFQVVPLGGVVSRFMINCNDGFVYMPFGAKLNEKMPKPDKFAWGQKCTGYIRGLLHIITPLLPFVGKKIVIWLGVPISFITVLMDDLKEKEGIAEMEVKDKHFAPVRVLKGCCEAFGSLFKDMRAAIQISCAASARRLIGCFGPIGRCFGSIRRCFAWSLCRCSGKASMVHPDPLQ